MHRSQEMCNDLIPLQNETPVPIGVVEIAHDNEHHNRPAVAIPLKDSPLCSVSAAEAICVSAKQDLREIAKGVHPNYQRRVVFTCRCADVFGGIQGYSSSH